MKTSTTVSGKNIKMPKVPSMSKEVKATITTIVFLTIVPIIGYIVGNTFNMGDYWFPKMAFGSLALGLVFFIIFMIWGFFFSVVFGGEHPNTENDEK